MSRPGLSHGEQSDNPIAKGYGATRENIFLARQVALDSA